MEHFKSLRVWILPAVVVAIAAAAVATFLSGCANTTPKSPSAPAPTAFPGATNAVLPQSLTGAELYAINCNRCHPERSPIERRSTEWKTILTHMRVRANLPAAQARLILQYLQDNSGS